MCQWVKLTNNSKSPSHKNKIGPNWPSDPSASEKCLLLNQVLHENKQLPKSTTCNSMLYAIQTLWEQRQIGEGHGNLRCHFHGNEYVICIHE